MSECYECGAYVATGSGARREVQTGRNSTISFTSKGRARHSSGTRYSKRTLCINCAKAHDETQALAGKITGFLILGIIAFVVWLAFSGENNPPQETTASAIQERVPSDNVGTTERSCEILNYPCQLNNIIASSDWTKIKHALAFSASFESMPVDINWDNPETGNSGVIRFLSVDRNKCINYEFSITINGDENKQPLIVCKNPDGSLSVE